jgi:hypothetical protein
MDLRNILQPRYVIATTIVVLLLMLPSVVSAQRVIPHAFLGSATVNGSPAANGTVVAALVDGQQVAAKSVTGGTYPVLLVEPSGESFDGKTVTFTIGGIAAAQTFIWQQGEVTELNLTATPVIGSPAATPTPAPVLVLGPKGDAGPSGQQGLQGVQGSAGPPGSGGPAGPAGSAGSAGSAGVAGAQGPPGSQGLTGPDGDSGADGSSLVGILALIFAVLAFLGTFGGMVWRRLVE